MQPEVVLLFDGTCGICTRLARWVRARDRAGRILVLPNQTPGILARYGLSRAAADRDAWAFDAAGRAFAGADAINRVLRSLGGGWALLAGLVALPGLHRFERYAYRWIADHRRYLARLGVTPECARPGAACE
jgi:predicted DCC family thiol-disulfide oxidoreductase YuxK